jgi:hypothetical protein
MIDLGIQQRHRTQLVMELKAVTEGYLLDLQYFEPVAMIGNCHPLLQHDIINCGVVVTLVAEIIAASAYLPENLYLSPEQFQYCRDRFLLQLVPVITELVPAVARYREN